MKELIANEDSEYKDKDKDLEMDVYEEARHMALRQLDLADIDPESEEFKSGHLGHLLLPPSLLSPTPFSPHGYPRARADEARPGGLR